MSGIHPAPFFTLSSTPAVNSSKPSAKGPASVELTPPGASGAITGLCLPQARPDRACQALREAAAAQLQWVVRAKEPLTSVTVADPTAVLKAWAPKQKVFAERCRFFSHYWHLNGSDLLHEQAAARTRLSTLAKEYEELTKEYQRGRNSAYSLNVQLTGAKARGDEAQQQQLLSEGAALNAGRAKLCEGLARLFVEHERLQCLLLLPAARQRFGMQLRACVRAAHLLVWAERADWGPSTPLLTIKAAVLTRLRTWGLPLEDMTACLSPVMAYVKVCPVEEAAFVGYSRLQAPASGAPGVKEGKPP